MKVIEKVFPLILLFLLVVFFVLMIRSLNKQNDKRYTDPRAQAIAACDEFGASSVQELCLKGVFDKIK